MFCDGGVRAPPFLAEFSNGRKGPIAAPRPIAAQIQVGDHPRDHLRDHLRVVHHKRRPRGSRARARAAPVAARAQALPCPLRDARRRALDSRRGRAPTGGLNLFSPSGRWRSGAQAERTASLPLLPPPPTGPPCGPQGAKERAADQGCRDDFANPSPSPQIADSGQGGTKSGHRRSRPVLQSGR